MSDTVTEILACLRAWEPSARVIGNITAGNAIEAIERLRDERAEVQEKALRFDLDQAGIEQREREAVELVTLRAEIETLKKDAERYRWLAQNVTHCPANATPILAAVSNRIWYHATCDTRHDTLGSMIDAALAAKGKD